MESDKLKIIGTRTHCMDLKSNEKMVHSLDFSGTILDVSPAWLKTMMYERIEVIGRHFAEFLDIKSLIKAKNHIPCVAYFGFVDNASLNMVRKDRVVIAVLITSTAKYTDAGKFERTFCEITLVKTKDMLKVEDYKK